MPNNGMYMPGVSALWAGQNQALSQESKTQENRKLVELIRDLEQKRQFAAQEQPYEIEKRRLANESSAAQIPGHHADSVKKGLEAVEYGQTSPGRVLGTNAENAGKVHKQKITTIEDAGRLFREASIESAEIPAVDRARWVSQRMLEAGFPLDNPEFTSMKQQLFSGNPEELPQKMHRMSLKLLEIDKDFAKNKYSTDSNASTSRANHRDNALNQQTLTRMRIEAANRNKKQEATDFDSQVDSWFKKAGTPQDKYTVLTRAAVMALQAGMPDKAANLQAQADAIEKTAKANIDKNRPPGADTSAYVEQRPGLDLRNPNAPGSAAPDGTRSTKSGVKWRPVENKSSLVNK